MKKIDFIEEKNYEVWYADGIVNTPPFKLMFECYCELLKKDLAGHITPWRNTSLLIWIQTPEKEVLGGICYDYLQDRKEGWINFSFTSPDYRRNGINALCLSYVEKDCIRQGLRTLAGVVSPNNTIAIQSALNSGRTLELCRYSKKI